MHGTRGIKDLEITLGGELVWTGQIPMGKGHTNVDYSEIIRLGLGDLPKKEASPEKPSSMIEQNQGLTRGQSQLVIGKDNKMFD